MAKETTSKANKPKTQLEEQLLELKKSTKKASDKAKKEFSTEDSSVSASDSAAAISSPREFPKAVKDELGRSYATGKRKNAIARVWVKAGKGNITINGKEYKQYFGRPVLRMIINQPTVITNRENQFDVFCTVTGGGLSGQAGAIRHGISRALTYFEPELRPILKSIGFLTRDDRIVERKKYGRAKARRSFQFSKR